MSLKERYALIQMAVKFYATDEDAESIRTFYREKAEEALREIVARRVAEKPASPEKRNEP